MSPQSASMMRSRETTHSQGIGLCRHVVGVHVVGVQNTYGQGPSPGNAHAELDPCDVAFHLVDIAPSTIPHSAPRSVDDQQGLHELHHIENPIVESQPAGESTVLYC